MGNLIQAAKAVLNQYSKSRSYLSADIDSDVMEALRQALADHIPDVSKMVLDEMQALTNSEYETLKQEPVAYVPMTDDEWKDLIWQYGLDEQNTSWRKYIEAEVVRRMKEQGII